MADWYQGTGLARCVVLHRLTPWRCSDTRTSAWRDNVATLRTEKSQGEMIVSIPILPILQRTLDAGPTGELAFVCGKNGKPLKKESFGNAFKDACRAAGLFNRSAHGCRKIAATRAAEAGATVAELNAIFGWK